MPKKSKSILREGKDGAKKYGSSADFFGFVPIWRDSQSVSAATLFLENQLNVLWLSDPSLSSPVEVHQVVEDEISELPKYIHRGYTIAIEPFEISIGTCAVIEDTSGTRLCVFEKAIRHIA